jgi:hypothetical protein
VLRGKEVLTKPRRTDNYGVGGQPENLCDRADDKNLGDVFEIGVDRSLHLLRGVQMAFSDLEYSGHKKCFCT